MIHLLWARGSCTGCTGRSIKLNSAVRGRGGGGGGAEVTEEKTFDSAKLSKLYATVSFASIK